MKKILVFNAHYFPGFLSGGIARTILNTSDWLSKDYDFFIVAKDRDLGDKNPYPNIELKKWNVYGKSKVRYLAPNELSFSSIKNLINKSNYDFIHLNSCYDIFFTLKVLILARLGLIKSKIILSPRGEFVEDVMKIKYFKKKTFVSLLKMLGMFNNITWHASLIEEAHGISNVIGIPLSSVKLAIDLPLHTSNWLKISKNYENKILKVFFFSRLTREKNLDGALKILKKVKKNIIFDVIGPNEDSQYYKECTDIAESLPDNIKVNFIGTIPSDKILESISSYDLMFFPSHGENFGHVVAETLVVGTKALITNLPAWPNLEKDGLGWNFDLKNHDDFVNTIENLADTPPNVRSTDRQNVISSAKKRLLNKKSLADNVSLYD